MIIVNVGREEVVVNLAVLSNLTDPADRLAYLTIGLDMPIAQATMVLKRTGFAPVDYVN